MTDDRLYLVHIAECIGRVRAYTADGRDAFLGDIKTQDAVLRNLQIICESTQRLSAEFKASRPGVDWQGISAFRNVVVHNYLGLRLDRVWEVIHDDLPLLAREVEAAIAEQRGPS